MLNRKHLLINDSEISGLKVIQRNPISDERGYLERLFCQETLGQLLQGKTIRQINRTLTQKKGTVRGLHFQSSPHAETKIVTCLKGQVWDVAVDLRTGSPTFLHSYAEVLSEGNWHGKKVSRWRISTNQILAYESYQLS